MKSLDNIAEDLFNKIRGRFPSVTIGDEAGKVTNDPIVARFFDFDYKEGDRNIGKVSISISEDKLAVMYSNSFVENEDTITRQNWYNFLKELRVFAKKRLLQFDTRDITKSNLDKRDYKFLAQQRGGEQTMSESTMYGTSKVSYQDIGNARLTIKHTESVNQEQSTGRTRKIGAIYVENTDGERFKYPYKHLNGARAMARHVAEGGKPYDDFGKHITGLSEELANLRKFKTYMNRSSVMAEGLAGYMGAVAERLETIKKTVSGLQKESFYKQAFESYEVPVVEDVPNDVAENWIDELTIRQFNEDLKDVFPFVYKLVGEATRAEELTPDDLMSEKKSSPAGGPACWDGYKIGNPKTKEGKNGKRVNNCVPEGSDPITDALDDIMGQFSDKPQAQEKPQPEKPQIPMTEFILSLFDREEGQFPKGETAVLTAIEKDYGEEYIDPAKQFIERIQETYATYAEGTVMEPTIEQDEEMGGDKDLLDPLKGAYGELFGKQPKKEDPEKIALDQAMKKYKNNPKGLKAWLMKNRNIIVWLNTRNDSGEMLHIVKSIIGETTKKTEAQEIRELGDRLMKLAGL